jgi:trehalose/maltose hydrolase-like predicted phosphorylase
MSFSVYSIVSAQLGRANDAYSYFQRSYQPNTRPPFQAFSETPTNDEYFFAPALAALQAVLYGFSGLRLREESFVLGPCPPDHWTRLELRNLFIQGPAPISSWNQEDSQYAGRWVTGVSVW